MSNPTLVQFHPDADAIAGAGEILAVNWEQLMIAAALTIGLTTIVALVIRKPLYDILQLICGSDVGARFWSTFTSILMVLGPLFLVFTAAGGAQNLADFVRRTIYLVSFGIIGAFLAMGAAVMLNAQSKPRQ